MMIIYRLPVQAQGGCNFCDQGVLGADGRSLVYPYTHVTYVEPDGRGTTIKACDNCLKEIARRADDIRQAGELKPVVVETVPANDNEEVVASWRQNEKEMWYRAAGFGDATSINNWMAYISDGVAFVRIKPFSFDYDDGENWISSVHGNDNPLAWCDELLEKLGHKLKNPKLLPCAHCGGEAEVYQSEDYKKESDGSGASYNDVGIRCTECPAHIHQDAWHAHDNKGRELRMVAAWNKRK